MDTLTVAVIQMDSGSDYERNMARAEVLCRSAANQRAQLIVLPEMVAFRGEEKELRTHAEVVPGKTIRRFQALARELKLFILAGSICERCHVSRKVYNTSVLINPGGRMVARYRKMHLFEASVQGTSIRESDFFLAGKKPIIADVLGFNVGLSICFDLRFSWLYDYYHSQDVDLNVVPASFTAKTGEAHWEVLLRARAIETQSFVLAANQVGIGQRGVATYGHSMIIDPWGTVLAQADGTSECVLVCELDLSQRQKVRERIPMGLD